MAWILSSDKEPQWNYIYNKTPQISVLICGVLFYLKKKGDNFKTLIRD